MCDDFSTLGLAERFLETIAQLGFTQPTPIQQAAIPALLEGRNVIGQAQTGTGKTAAYALPMLQRITSTGKLPRALVLAPTRELAMQVSEAINTLGRGSNLHVLPIYGGQSYLIQKRGLAKGVDILVATPGRLIDLIGQNAVDLSEVTYLVLDEADEMLEMGFIEDVETILGYVRWERQTALFSATLPDAVRKLANQYMTEPFEIKINPSRLTVEETEQRVCRLREDDKLPALMRLLETEEVKSALVFARTKARAQDIADSLAENGFTSEALHGDLSQARRETVLGRFRQHAVSILVATDVAARGLDIEDVTHVFNYDSPDDLDSYVHRIGRTGRAGRRGVAITFFTPRERARISLIERVTRQALIEQRIPSRDEIQARRDERFIQRVYEQLTSGGLDAEQSLLARLTEAGLEPLEVAAAAIRMARAGEPALPQGEIYQPSAERPELRERRPERRGADRRDYNRGAERNDRRPSFERSELPPRAARRSRDRSEAGMVRLVMNLGGAHGVRPSDVVGAIASESGIPGRAIGMIDIQRTHTFVDVAEQHVQQVLSASTGRYNLRGKPVTLMVAN